MSYFHLLERLVSELLSSISQKSQIDLNQQNFETVKNIFFTELYINITKEEFFQINEGEFLKIIDKKLERDLKGDTIINLFEKVERIAKIELNNSIELKWFDKWENYYSLGNWINSPDSLDFIEMFLRIEEELGISTGVYSNITESDLGGTVGETVKYFWKMNLRKNHN